MTSRSVRRLFVGAALLFGAGFSGIAALSIASERRASGLAMALPYNTGFAKAAFGRVYLQAGEAGQPTAALSVKPGVIGPLKSLSLAAYMQEPLNPTALAELGLAKAARGREAEAKTAMQLAQRMSRRDLVSALWLMGWFGKQDDSDALLALFDNMLRTSLPARQMLMPAFVRLLADPRMVTGAIPLLNRGPDWETAFWHEAYRHTEGLLGAAEVRMRRSTDGFVRNPESDRRLVAALAVAKEYDTADRLVSALAPDIRKDGELVRNAGLDQGPDHLPFDWDIIPNSSASVAVDSAAGVLSIQTVGRAGPFTRQLVALPTGVLRLTAVRSKWRGQNPPRLEISLNCAATASSALARFPLERTTTTLNFQRPSPDCVYYWLQLSGEGEGGGGENSVEVSRISLTPSQN